MLAALALAAASAWLGVLLFHAAVVAPSAFQALDREEAGAVVRRVFPRYHAAGLVLGLGGGLAAGLAHAQGPGRWAAYALVAAAVTTAVSWGGLTPRMREAREAGADDRYRRLHGRSMVLNLAAILLVAGGVAGAVWAVAT